MTLTPEIIAGFAGTLLSLAFSYVPGISDWFATLDSTKKSGLMALMIIVVGGIAYGLSCANIIQALPCSQDGLVKLAQVIFVALVGNQSAYSLSPTRKPKLTPVAPEVPPAAVKE